MEKSFRMELAGRPLIVETGTVSYTHLTLPTNSLV